MKTSNVAETSKFPSKLANWGLGRMAKDFVSVLKALKTNSVHIKHADVVNKKINGIVTGGFGNLQVVSDFDLTITKQHENGKRHISSFGMFRCCPSVTKEYVQRTEALFDQYHPIEINPNLDVEEKTKHMIEWYTATEDAIKGLKVSQEEINKVIEGLSPSLRDGSKELFRLLNENSVPVLVFSAGLGDTVVSVLNHYGVLLPNVKVISNYLKYDEDGTIVGFKSKAIHVFNKNEYAIKDSEYYDSVKDRGNVILMGDSLGDANMADGISHEDYILRIGFIFEKIESNLPAYLDKFDIVLEDDQTMDVITAIIKAMSGYIHGFY